MKSILGGLLFDRKPEVPEAPQVNAQAEQLAALRGNINAFPEIADLTKRANELSTDELMKALEKMMPGYGKLLETGTKQIGSMVKGELPQDVVRNLRQYAAETGASTGTAGSTFNANQLLRNLGLTSLDVIGRGLSAAERWTASATSRLPLHDFSSMFITPGQQIQNAWMNQESQFNRQWLANRIKAMPEGWESAVQGLLDWVATTGSQVVSSYAGGGMGSMMGGAGGAGGGAGPYGGGSSWG